ncbi:MAG TPA: T9SS type A sorting domain-containing protein, partial [Bacteroidia bacterium]|nr:T9SS type A sorting domain-containing protein [Bacteroidia bacterium]
YLLSGNPITANSSLTYTLSKNAQIQLNLTDMSGKTISIENQLKSKGSYTVNLNPEDYKLAAGTYLLSMIMDGTTAIQEKIAVVK